MKFHGKIEAMDPGMSLARRGSQLPITGIDGDLFVLTSQGFGSIYLYNGGTWHELSAAGGGTLEIEAGALSELPPAGTAGRLYIATDVGRMLRDTGTSWDVLGGKVVRVVTTAIAPKSGTSLIQLSNSRPTITQGSQIWSQSITPYFATSKILIQGSLVFDCSSSGRELTVCLFRDSTCIGVTSGYISSSARPQTISFNIADSPGTSTVTYSIRVGVNSWSTWYVNQSSSAYFNGLYAANGVTMMEVL